MKSCINKSLLLISSVFLLRIIISCCECGEENDEIFWSGVNTRTYNKGPYFATMDTMPIENLLIKVEMETYFAEKQSFGFENTYALDCICAQEYADTIVDLRIISLNNYSAILPADADVTHCFEAQYKHDSPHVKIKDVLDRYSLGSYEHIEFFLCFREQPEFIDTYRFKLILSLASGKKIEHTTDPVYLY